MHEHAKNLEFEQAAAVRDDVKHLRDLIIVNS
jgi:excinuclease ABC subunit B